MYPSATIPDVRRKLSSIPLKKQSNGYRGKAAGASSYFLIMSDLSWSGTMMTRITVLFSMMGGKYDAHGNT